MNMQNLAEHVRQYAKENPSEPVSHLIYETIWKMNPDTPISDIVLSDHYDDQFLTDDIRMYWVLPDAENDPTVCIWETIEGTMQIEVGVIDEVILKIKTEYAAKHDGQVCKACGGLVHKDCIECPDCGKFVDGTECPELMSLISDEKANCLEDGGSDRYVWLLKERLPTHETKSRHTHLFITLDLMPEEGRYRGKFEKPECWCVSIEAVNVGMAGKQGAADAMRSFGMSEDEWKKLSIDSKAAVLRDYGTRATLFQDCGYSPVKLVQKALEELVGVLTIGGAYLDANQNAIGATGWDFMSGDIVPKRLLR